jgi:hypothetical protein
MGHRLVWKRCLCGSTAERAAKRTNICHECGVSCDEEFVKFLHSGVKCESEFPRTAVRELEKVLPFQCEIAAQRSISFVLPPAVRYEHIK